jgi:hypothetical protein
MFLKLFGGLVTLLCLAATVQAQDPCYGEAECYNLPATIESQPEAASPPWEGFSDGRLNPNMAEYYSVWCVNGEVRVLRAVPPPTV